MAAKAMVKWRYEAMVTAAGTEKIFYLIDHKFKSTSNRKIDGGFLGFTGMHYKIYR